MKQAGTDSHNGGLYDVPRLMKRPTQEEIDDIPAGFPELAEVSSLVQLMVQIDARCENLGRTQATGWSPPNTNSDFNVSHEALIITVHYQEAGRLPKVQERPVEFQEMLTKAENEMLRLERALRLMTRWAT